MQIIRPYGRSIVKTGEERRIELRPAGSPAERQGARVQNIAELMEFDRLIISGWISVIDKIIVKPFAKDSQGKKREESAALQKAEQYRKWLGAAAWGVLKTDFGLSVFNNGVYKTEAERAEKEKQLKDLWDKKINETQKGKIKRRDFPQGRWYGSFVSAPIERFSPSLAENVADKINGHLNLKTRKIVPQGRHSRREKSGGAVKNQDRAISCNTLQNAWRKVQSGKAAAAVDKALWEKYSAAAGGKIAALIKDRILQEQEKAEHDKEKSYNLAVETLRKDIWPQVFGNARSYETAAKLEEGAELLAAHKAVKETYKRLLKGRLLFVEKQKPLVSGSPDWQEKIKELVCGKLEQILPADDDALFALMTHKSQNRALNSLVRLGKIIHYTASRKGGETEDKVLFIAENWPSPAEVSDSHYWGSEGQTQIKQSEAFVRVWRRALAFAARNLKDWAEDPENEIGEGADIFGEKGRKFIAERCNETLARQKYQLLFSQEEEPPSQKELLETARAGAAALRNAAFHFKGLGTFTEALRGDEDFASANVKTFLQRYFQGHQQKSKERLKKSLETVGLPYYLKGGEAGALWHKISADNPSLLPLPRLRRVLERAAKAWKGDKQGKNKEGRLLPEIKLPNYVSAKEREKEEHEADNCQWAVLKLLYDGSFKTWLDARPHGDLQGYINRAVNRATQAARLLNGKNAAGAIKSAEDLLSTVARAERLKQLEDGDTIESFFYHLTAETATEMRVQKGYDSNGEQAKEQAKYIEDLKCDVVALAFEDYLQQPELSFVLDIDARHKSEKPLFDINSLPDRGESAAPQPWQAKLYFLLHLISVEEISSLRQQLRKYQIATDERKAAGGGKIADKDRAHLQQGDETALAAPLAQVLDLYIFMHDAQYVGNELNSLELSEEEKKLFYLNPSDFNAIFSAAGGNQGKAAARGEVAAKRDLRELQRFGGFRLFERQGIEKIKSRAVLDWNSAREEVEGKGKAQQILQDLHEEWIKNRKKPEWQPARKGRNGQQPMPDGEKYAEYKKNLAKVTRYRHLHSQVMLQDHLRLHRLLIAVLGRLVDFSGLFERDLYFAMLALLHKKQQGGEDRSNSASEKEGWFKKQFTDEGTRLGEGEIVRALKKIKCEQIKKEVKDSFSVNSCSSIRNDFAHFNMLQKNLPVNLTKEVNNARALMAYDRKLKNAVSQAVIELLEREGLLLTWQMEKENGAHNLCRAKLKTGKAYHLKKTKSGKKGLEEDKHGEFYVKVAAALFEPVE